MSESPQPASPLDARAGEEQEQIGTLPVLAGEQRIVRAQPAPGAVPGARRPTLATLPAVQAAAVAAGGFVAGAAVVGLVHRRHRRAAKLVRRGRAGRGVGQGAGRKPGRVAEMVEIVGSRSLLVDVHLLGGSGER